ncbi:MAG: ArsR/SmtB family transcription factor [Planctomycetaceae bacterium]
MTDGASSEDAVFRALADATRRLIIDDLQVRDGQSLFEICVRLGQIYDTHMSRQAITKHLKVLEEAGIVSVERQGRTRMHFLNVRPIKKLGRTWLKKYLK